MPLVPSPRTLLFPRGCLQQKSTAPGAGSMTYHNRWVNDGNDSLISCNGKTRQGKGHVVEFSLPPPLIKHYMCIVTRSGVKRWCVPYKKKNVKHQKQWDLTCPQSHNGLDYAQTTPPRAKARTLLGSAPLARRHSPLQPSTVSAARRVDDHTRAHQNHQLKT